eukprot:scaffold207_cov409-Prasinococcus_capsulatus_cf.AAC.129
MDTAQLINAHKKATQQIKMLKKRLKDNKHKDVSVTPSLACRILDQICFAGLDDCGCAHSQEHALIAPPYPVNFLV